MVIRNNDNAVAFISDNGATLLVSAGGEGRVNFVYGDVDGFALHPSLLVDIAHRVLKTDELDSFFYLHFAALSSGNYLA